MDGRDWPTFETWSLQISKKSTEGETRKIFWDAKDLIWELACDIGYSDRIFVFDSEEKFKEAQLQLCIHRIEWSKL